MEASAWGVALLCVVLETGLVPWGCRLVHAVIAGSLQCLAAKAQSRRNSPQAIGGFTTNTCQDPGWSDAALCRCDSQGRRGVTQAQVA